MRKAAIVASSTLTPVGYSSVSSAARTRNPFVLVVLAIRLTTTSRLSSGRPRQLRVIWQNMRCSILFHLLVPGGRGGRR